MHDPATLIDTLTGCSPEEVAQVCTLSDLRAARQLCDEALDLKERGPSLRMVPQERTG